MTSVRPIRQHGVSASALPSPVDTAHMCRSRLRQVVSALDERRGLAVPAVSELIESSSCPAPGHQLRVADVSRAGLTDTDADGKVCLSRQGDDWLLTYGDSSGRWGGGPGHSLRAWQSEALDAWAAHGRHGVVEAVTGTGKSRVGIEAIREAIRDGYATLLCVPTVDLVDQWITVLREHGVGRPTVLSEAGPRPLEDHDVVITTVQGLYANPPIRDDGRVLLVADECHRLGSTAWSRSLHSSYRRRLGLTATFERNDDGITRLLDYFGGTPVYTIGFDRAIRDGVVAHYDVELRGVALTPRERVAYDEADELLRDSRKKLLDYGMPREPFGAFMQAVANAADERHGDPIIEDVARRYLKAFSDRVDVLSAVEAKRAVVAEMAPHIAASSGTLVFTRRVDVAEELSQLLKGNRVPAAAIHGEVSRGERQRILRGLRYGRLKALVAPTVLDEGIDVPSVELGIVTAGSKSRRQMIQRMGRVLRLKPDGGKARFVVVYARGTVEDLDESKGEEGCLDLIVESADSVLKDGQSWNRENAAPEERFSGEPGSTLGFVSDVETSDTLTPRPEAAVDFDDIALTQQVLTDYSVAHGVDERAAATGLLRFVEAAGRQPEALRLDGDGRLRLSHQGGEVEIDLETRSYCSYRSTQGLTQTPSTAADTQRVADARTMPFGPDEARRALLESRAVKSYALEHGVDLFDGEDQLLELLEVWTPEGSDAVVRDDELTSQMGGHVLVLSDDRLNVRDYWYDERHRRGESASPPVDPAGVNASSSSASALTGTSPSPVDNERSCVVSQLERLAALHTAGALDADEFRLAKATVLRPLEGEADK